MGLNFNIPMVDNAGSFSKGFNFDKNLMQEIMARRELKEKQNQFKQEMELKKQNAARAGANSGLNREILQQRLLELKHKNDPNWQWQQFNNLFGSGSEGQSGQGGKPQGDQYPALNKMFSGQGAFPEGEIEHGNIDLNNRPKVPNPETGGESTVYSMSIGTPKGEVLIPRVSQDGRILSQDEAVDQFHKTGQHLGIYSSPEEATRAAEAIHQQQAQSVGAKPGQNLLDVLRNDPIKRAYFKYKYKFDPLAAVPQTPEEKANTEINTAATKEQQTLDIKRKDALQDELPQAEKLINDIEEAKKLINENKKLFGPGIGGLNFLGGPSQRKRGLKTKEEREAWGKIEDLFGTLVGKKATDFSHKGLKVAFDLAANVKPSFEEWPETAIAKLDKMENALKEGHGRDLQWYKEHGGKVGSKTRLKFNPSTGRLE